MKKYGRTSLNKEIIIAYLTKRRQKMKKIKATLTALVMAFVVTAGLGVVATTVDPVGNSKVVAQLAHLAKGPGGKEHA